MKLQLDDKGFVLISVMVAFFIIMAMLLPLVQNQMIGNQTLIQMEEEFKIDNLLESGIALATAELEKNRDFQGNKTIIYNGYTYEIQFTQDLINENLKISVRIPSITAKKIDVGLAKVDLSIKSWEEGFQYD